MAALTLATAISKYGHEAKGKLSNPVATGEPEDQLRSPLEALFKTELAGVSRNKVQVVGESSIASLHTRPDFAITLNGALVGFVEVKAPGTGADPNRYKGHNKTQWEKLKSLPNLLYTDGNQFSLWRSGKAAAPVVTLDGDIESSGRELAAPDELVGLFRTFLNWQPIPPRTASELADVTARLCRLLRDEVTERLAEGSPALAALRRDWQKLLFPEASDTQFADGYAQAVTFGLLMARARNIVLGEDLGHAAALLGRTNSLIGTALRVLTEESIQDDLKTSIETLKRVLDAVDWPTISKGEEDAWLYFYEQFLAVYDNALRKLTGSYYTPPEVVNAMVGLVDEVLRTRFQQPAGLASQAVTVADPAVGTGTFPLGVLRRIAATVSRDQGEGAVPSAVEAALKRLVAFEMQLGPFAVAQLRVHAELLALIGTPPRAPVRMFVTDTLASPFTEMADLGSFYAPISESRKQANRIKRDEKITVVIGNPPYKEKAKGRGGWIEHEDKDRGTAAPLDAWQAPRGWGAGTHAKHLRNLYVYFWRWATWKVFDHHPQDPNGVVCFITVAGFLNGPGFQKMRDYLRRTADDIWVIDCSPEGHQPDVPTRIFQGVKQPVCIVLASRSGKPATEVPAAVKFRKLPVGRREDKFVALSRITLDSDGWVDAPSDWRSPFLPEAIGEWATFPSLDNLFAYNGSGIMPGRTWVIAPDANSLLQRWRTLIKAKAEQKDALFVPHENHGVLGDRHVARVVPKGLPGYPDNSRPIAKETADCLPPIPYGFRSFDRQWIIPDNRVLNRPNPELWRSHSSKQIYLTAWMVHSPASGPALTFTNLVPDLHHYRGSIGGRVFPLWRDPAATVPNLPPKLLKHLAKKYKTPVTAEDFLAYIAAVAAHPAYTARFQPDLATPGLRIPVTAKAALFAEAVEIGRTVIWLHTFGERYVDAKAKRPPGPPKVAVNGPRIPKPGMIPADPEGMPDEMLYEPDQQRLFVGTGFVDNVSPAVWAYEVSGKRVLTQWFSYRKKDRSRPLYGDKRPPSELEKIRPETWLAEYTTELLNVLHVLTRLVELESSQAALLGRICAAPTITRTMLAKDDVLSVPDGWRKKLVVEADLFGHPDDEAGD